jgi:hypothetical protein
MRTSAYTGVKQQGKKPGENMRETAARKRLAERPSERVSFKGAKK